MFLSGVVRRVVRSTLAAEGCSISECQETCEWLRMVIADMVGKRCASLKEVERYAEAWPMVVVTDSQSLADTVHSDAGSTNDERAVAAPAIVPVIRDRDTRVPAQQPMTFDIGTPRAETLTPPPAALGDRMPDADRPPLPEAGGCR